MVEGGGCMRLGLGPAGWCADRAGVCGTDGFWVHLTGARRLSAPRRNDRSGQTLGRPFWLRLTGAHAFSSDQNVPVRLAYPGYMFGPRPTIQWTDWT